MPHTLNLIRRVAARLSLASFGGRFYFLLWIAAGIFAGMLLLSKLLGILPDDRQMWLYGVAAVPALAALGALFTYRRAGDEDAAHAIDVQMRTKDLFLTSAMLYNTKPADAADGAFEYAPLVTSEAEKHAPSVRPQTVVPFNWGPRAANVAVMMVVLVGMLFIPQFDPLGLREQEQLKKEREQKLVEDTKKAEERIKQLAMAKPEEKHSTRIMEELRKVERTFQQLKKEDQKGNREALKKQQQATANLFKQMQEERKDELQKSSMQQARFGSALNQQMKQAAQKLKDGDAAEMKQTIDEIKKLAKEFSETQDEKKKEELKQQMQDKLQQAMDAMNKEGATSPQAQQAMQQAMDQLQMSGMEGVDPQQAMDAMQQSLDMSQAEMDQLAQQMRDMQAMQQAMNAIQNAQQANSQQSLDGSQCAGCNGMADYEKLYNEMMGQGQGQGEGPGQGGENMQNLLTRQGEGGQGEGQGQGGMGQEPGQGEGGIAPEDPTQQTTFKPEREKTHMQAGRILMSWREKGEAPTGAVDKTYDELLNDVRQGAAEAIEAEDIPPGYHDTIRKYFHQTAPPSTENENAAEQTESQPAEPQPAEPPPAEPAPANSGGSL